MKNAKLLLLPCLLSSVFLASTCGCIDDGYIATHRDVFYLKNNTGRILFVQSSLNSCPAATVYPSDSVQIGQKYFREIDYASDSTLYTAKYSVMKDFLFHVFTNTSASDSVVIQPMGQNTCISYYSNDTLQGGKNFFSLLSWQEHAVKYENDITVYGFTFAVNEDDINK
ncbi:MAG: hypothetical protein IJ250_01745 [Bacteroidales bacterium]|nr:hypothetical protein [Bacteroidales bacterium]